MFYNSLKKRFRYIDRVFKKRVSVVDFENKLVEMLFSFQQFTSEMDFKKIV